jgi:hypothetical protein
LEGALAEDSTDEALAQQLLERVVALIEGCTEKCTLRQSGARDNKNGMRRCGTMRPLHEIGSTE